MLIKFDNILNTKDLNYIKSIISSPRWEWGHFSNSSDNTNFWKISNLESDTFFSDYLFNKIQESVNEDLILDSVYMNGHTASGIGKPHYDTKDDNGRTFLIYVNSEWMPEYGGGTMFITGDEVATVAYKPNSAIYFQNNILHCAAPISREFNGLRVTLAFKMKKI